MVTTAFGIRGSAERAVYYAIYIAEEILPEGDMKFAASCKGSRKGLGGQAGRCYLSEFLAWIDRKDVKKINYDAVMIGSSTTEIGKLKGDWGIMAGMFRDDIGAEKRVEIIVDCIEGSEFREVKKVNPPSENVPRSSRQWVDWLAANPDWKEGMKTGEPYTKAVVVQDKGGVKVIPSAIKPKPFRGNLNYEHIDGIARDDSPAKYQEFVKTLSYYQRRLNTAFEASTDDTKEKFKTWFTTMTVATDRVIEMRKGDHFKNVLHGRPKDARSPSLRKIFGTDLQTDVIKGSWESWEAPKRQATTEAAVKSGRFKTLAEAEEAFDKLASSPKSIEHINVFTNWSDTRGRYQGTAAASVKRCP
ncbi:hypothetical protein RJ55_03945 [Drechmeria coniospora]|nr:hypothetical protein RJ55_03945 [Drechmeria coniospora]